MKKKSGLFILILFLAIGFAALSTSLIINGTSLFGTNVSDFDVIFTKSVIDGVDVSESTISEDGVSLTFTTSELAIIGDTCELDFEVTNNSTQYDANVTMECVVTGEKANTYYKVESELPEVINAASKENGDVTVTLLKTSVDEIEETFTCTINATAQERTEVGKRVSEWIYTDLDSDGKISEGDVYTLVDESFNVISQTDDTITMLAQKNLDANYKQNEEANTVTFSETNGWEYAPGPKEIDIFTWSTNPKNYINEYIAYLQEESGVDLSGNLMTVTELGNLGCGINANYTYTNGVSCKNSSNASWLVNGQTWWTRSARPGIATHVWIMNADGTLYRNDYNELSGIRPVITISKDSLNN